MKDRVVLSAVIIAGIGFLVGLIGKFAGTHLLVSNATWHEFTQTCLLFAIAWGIGKGVLIPKSSS